MADRSNAAEEMAVEGELVINAIDATSGGTVRLSAQKHIQLDTEARMWGNQRKQQHPLKRQRMPQKWEKLIAA